MLQWLRALVRSYWPGTDDEDDVWDAIPGSQYAGRHAESGGLTRGEQEAAIADVQKQAEELDEN
ncbi:hypothetical protein [Halorubellus sp. PRR65]|uniref:hypothetical protein n=1 Tax=Halorubellus sp. PRR65 TaxID=3098148 RepID=UPI002B26100B|nr:hypothetical protein [Halorubellus sp. PRR65]